MTSRKISLTAWERQLVRKLIKVAHERVKNGTIIQEAGGELARAITTRELASLEGKFLDEDTPK